MIFLLIEAFNSIKRGKAGAFFSFASIFLSIVFSISALLIFDIGKYIEQNLKNNFTLQIYLKENVLENQINQLRQKILSKYNIKSLKYINKEEAEKIFLSQTGEDFKKFLKYNPLPASILVSLKIDNLKKEELNSIINDLKKYPEVEEIAFEEEYLNIILKILDKTKYYVISIAFVLIFLSIFIVKSVFKMIIKSRALVFETMKLVGARILFIRGVVALSGLMIGFFASAFFYLTFVGLKKIFEQKTSVNLSLLSSGEYYSLLILLIGPLLGFLGAFGASREISLNIDRNKFVGL